MTNLRHDGQPVRRLSRLAWLFVLAFLLVTPPPCAQFLRANPPPVPPKNVPEAPAPSGPAISLAPPSPGPATTPGLPATLTQPPVTTAPPPAPTAQANLPGQGVVALSARFGKDLP